MGFHKIFTWKNYGNRLVFETLFLPLQPKQKGGYGNTREKKEKLNILHAHFRFRKRQTEWTLSSYQPI